MTEFSPSASPVGASPVAAQIRKVDHVAVAVHDLAPAVGLFVHALGGVLISGGDNEESGTRLIQLSLGHFKIELMQSLRDDSQIARHLKRRGPGFHHLTFMVDDVIETVSGLESLGLTVAGTDLSSINWRETFISPSATFGALLQFVDTPLRWDVPTTLYTLDDVLSGRIVWRDRVACLR